MFWILRFLIKIGILGLLIMVALHGIQWGRHHWSLKIHHELTE